MQVDLDKKWKYLQFRKDDGPDGWSLDFSDKPSEIPRDKLLSIAEINGRVKRDETFSLVFNAIASDAQLIECSDGLHEAVVLLGSTQRWKFFPVHFNRTVYRQLSHHVRTRKQYKPKHLIVATDVAWMNIPQLEITRRLLIELFEAQDTSEIDRLIVFKQENSAV